MNTHARHRRFFILLWICFLTCIVQVGLAQDLIKVQGRVTGKNGEGLSRATITVVGKKQSQISDSAGRFSISVPTGATLQISYVGYFIREIKVTSAQTLAVQLQENPNYQQMNDVVVVGYGTQKLPTVTGAVGVISGRDLIQTPVANITNMLIGRTAGVSGIQATGEPGLNTTTIRIRGIATLTWCGILLKRIKARLLLKP